jgi:outer membrane protein TolC
MQAREEQLQEEAAVIGTLGGMEDTDAQNALLENDLLTLRGLVASLKNELDARKSSPTIAEPNISNLQSQLLSSNADLENARATIARLEGTCESTDAEGAPRHFLSMVVR